MESREDPAGIRSDAKKPQTERQQHATHNRTDAVLKGSESVGRLRGMLEEMATSRELYRLGVSEDAAQDAACWLLGREARCGSADIDEPKAFIIKSVKGKRRDHERKQRTRYEVALADSFDLEGDEEGDEWGFARVSMELALEQLSPRERELIRLRFEVGLSPARIMEAMEYGAYGSVTSSINRALNKLRRLCGVSCAA